MDKVKVFIGSSTEQLDVARKIKRHFENDSDISAAVWNERRDFQMGQSVLESLMGVVERYDFAILVLNADDKVESRGDKKNATRDNVLFELGMFMGGIGRERTFFIYSSNDNLKIPSDLVGITCASYKARTGNLMDDLSTAVDKIRDQIRDHGPRPKVPAMMTQAGIFNRIINASMFPKDDYIESEFLDYVNSQRPESIASMKDVVAFSRDLFRYYLFPLVRPSEMRNNFLRIYFAYFLGDGVPFKSGECPTDCADEDLEGREFKGHFVIGMSNPSPAPVERNWLEGRVLAGYDEDGGWLSNCAAVFMRGKENNIPNVDELKSPDDNFEVPDEKAIYTVPIYWSMKKDERLYKATIGVLAVSSKRPYGIQKETKTRANALATLLGFLFSLHALQNLDQLDAGFEGCPPQKGRLIGFSPAPPEEFARRVTALRQKIAKHFEASFIRRGLHTRDGNRLACKQTSYAVTPGR